MIVVLDTSPHNYHMELARTADQLKATNFHIAENLLQDLLERDKKRALKTSQ